MNLRGSGMYSKATNPMRNTSAGRNLHLKLIFVYPMMFDSFLQKNKQQFRDFLSNTFLREIFTANFLNLVNLTNQISPLEDSSGKKVDLAGELGGILVGQGQGQGMRRGGSFGGFYSEKQMNKEELQRKIKEKTETIKLLIKSDPQLKTLNPKIQFVTLENMIDVPVIVGTKPLDVDSFTLSMFLFFAIALKLPIDNFNNVKKIVTTIKRTDKNSLVKLLDYETEKTGILYNLIERVKQKFSSSRYSKKIIKFTKSLKGPDSSEHIGDRSVLFPLLDTFMSKIDELELFFRFMLDESELRSRYGLTYNTNLETTVKRISPHADKIFAKLDNNLQNAISEPVANILRSYDRLFVPEHDVYINFEETFNEFISKRMASKLSNFVTQQLRPDLENYVRDLNVNQTGSINDVKSLCADISDDVDRLGNFINKLNQTKIHFSVKNGDESVARLISNYVNTMDSISSKIKPLSNKSRKKLNKILPNMLTIISNFENIVDGGVAEFMNHYIKNTNQDEVIRSVQMQGDQQFDVNGLKNLFYEWITNIIQYIFLTSIAIAICEYVKILDVEIETAKNEVTDFPNYCLVLSEEILYALYSAYVTKNFRKLLQGENVSFSSKKQVNLSSAYTKSMVRYINKKLRVPNLIVVNNRGDVHYKFMNLTDVNKSRINTIETFNNLNWKSSSNQQSNYFAY